MSQHVQTYNAHSLWKMVCKTSSHGTCYIAHRHLGRSTDRLSTAHLVCLFLCNHLLLKICSGTFENLPRFYFPRPGISFFFFFTLLNSWACRFLLEGTFQFRGNCCVKWLTGPGHLFSTPSVFTCQPLGTPPSFISCWDWLQIIQNLTLAWSVKEIVLDARV